MYISLEDILMIPLGVAIIAAGIFAITATTETIQKTRHPKGWSAFAAVVIAGASTAFLLSITEGEAVIPCLVIGPLLPWFIYLPILSQCGWGRGW